MRRNPAFYFIAVLMVWGPALSRPLAAAEPTASMFKGRVTEAAGGGTLGARAAAACRDFAAESGGAYYFTAFAFPAAEPIRSCQRRHSGAEGGPLALDGRGGRIVVSRGGEHGLNLGSGPGAEKGPPSWGVLLVLNGAESGRCRVQDVEILAPDREYSLNAERLHWLGSADEGQSLEYIRGLLQGAAGDRALRKSLVFVLYVLDGTEALSDLIRLARRDPDPGVRKDAIFWLGQKASAAAVRTLEEVISSPESLEIKKQAIFALSQLEGDRGTPLLLEIARRNPHPALRRQAIFWLGESGDPRALDFFEEILLK